MKLLLKNVGKVYVLDYLGCDIMEVWYDMEKEQKNGKKNIVNVWLVGIKKALGHNKGI